MTHKTCPALPAELWGQICSYNDDLTLWMVYRYVSKLLRSEAEREFAQTRLPQLDLTWTCIGDVTCKNRQFSFISDSKSRREPSQLLGLSQDDTRAHFYINSIHVTKPNDGGDLPRNLEAAHMMTRRAEQALR